MAFPNNPSDKMIFEASQDIFYIYDQQTLSWRKLPHSIKLPLATPYSDGAMSSVDYVKLLNIKSNPFTTTLTSDQCDLTFSSGVLSLGSDEFIDIRTTSNFGNPATGMPNVEMKLKPNKNTAIIDITVNPQKLALELLRRHNLTLKGAKGNKGQKGPKGPDGQKVETGPKGATGSTGKSSCGASVAEDSLEVAGIKADGTAIVDIATQITPSGSTKLIAYRGVIGDDSIAPYTIDVANQVSSWVVALSGTPEDTVVQTDLKACTIPGLDVPSGGQRLYYMDITPIISAIQDKYYSEVERIRLGAADVARFWLEIMEQLYKTSKDAMCCALYECKKQQAIDEAAAADGSAGGTGGTDTPPAGFLSPSFASHQALSALSPTDLHEINLAMTPQAKSASAVLQPGLYRLRYLKYPITGINGAHAEFTINYRHSSKDKSVRVTGFKASSDINSVRLNYTKFNTTISHDGGPILTNLMSFSTDDSGEVLISLTRLNDQKLGIITPDDFDILVDACSSGNPGWMAIVKTTMQNFVVFKLNERRFTSLLSFGRKISDNQHFAIPSLGNEMIDCSGEQLCFDDAVRDSIIRAINDGSYDLYKGQPSKIDMVLGIAQTGILCPWSK